MDKKAKKRIDVLQLRMQQLRAKLAGCRKQADDPSEIQQLEKQVAETEAEILKLRSSPG